MKVYVVEPFATELIVAELLIMFVLIA